MSAMGLRQEKVESVPDGSVSDLITVELGAGPAVRASDVFFTSNPNDGSKDPAAKVRDHVLLAGWLLENPGWNYPFSTQEDPSSSAPWVEDIHYRLLLDADFVDHMYGPDGLSTALLGAKLPGNLYDPQNIPHPLPFGDIPPDATGARYATVGAFHLPAADTWQGQPTLQIELNCWHTRPEIGPMRDLTHPYQIDGRGAAPPGWVHVWQDTIHHGWKGVVPWQGVVDDCWWPFNPNNPDNQHGWLLAGAGVMVCGSLWQDHEHDPGPNWWERVWPGQGGWLEMHPPDWIHRFVVPAGPSRTACRATGVNVSKEYSQQITATMTSVTPWAPHGRDVVLEALPDEVIDARFLTTQDADHFTERHVTATGDNKACTVNVVLHPRTGHDGGLFAATYRAGWKTQVQHANGHLWHTIRRPDGSWSGLGDVN
ncbi:hypothetical protein, partial [Microlunatus ginsengisoli]|uniref:hypothetical protein n=1 Tax=Microlunatus ginsengisoli TaxID=363863 RepID=UPI0031E42B79